MTITDSDTAAMSTTTLLTHIALPVGDFDATLAFYAKYTNLVVIHDRSSQALPARSQEAQWPAS